LKANEWVSATLEVVGGRGGGKPGNAQGQAANCDNIEEIIGASDSFASQKLGATV